jgi:hypothetical protein
MKIPWGVQKSFQALVGNAFAAEPNSIKTPSPATSKAGKFTPQIFLRAGQGHHLKVHWFTNRTNEASLEIRTAKIDPDMWKRFLHRHRNCILIHRFTFYCNQYG